jgi:hypothetical protein
MTTKKVEIKRRHPALILLNILLDGHPVKMEDDEWMIQDGKLGVVRDSFDASGKKQDTYLLHVDYDLSHFIKLCERQTEETIQAAVFSHVVTNENRRRLS